MEWLLGVVTGEVLCNYERGGKGVNDSVSSYKYVNVNMALGFKVCSCMDNKCSLVLHN